MMNMFIIHEYLLILNKYIRLSDFGSFAYMDVIIIFVTMFVTIISMSIYIMIEDRNIIRNNILIFDPHKYK